MKKHRLSLNLLEYIRANLVFSYKFKNEQINDRITVSTAVDTGFELHCLHEASQLLSSMLEKYKTSMEYDLYLLDVISRGNDFVPKTEEDLQALKVLS